MFHFHLLWVGSLSFFCFQRCFITRALVHKGAVRSGKLLSQPLWARAVGSSGERLWASCAPCRLVAVQPIVGMPSAYDWAVVEQSLLASTPGRQQLLLLYCQQPQCSDALLSAENAWTLLASADSQKRGHCTVDSAAHKHHTHHVSALSMHEGKSPRAASKSPKCLLASRVTMLRS